MATPDSQFPHSQLDKARQYKAEFLMRRYGVTSAAAEGTSSSKINIFDVTSSNDDIIGLGFGSRMTNGVVVQGEEAIRVYVREKTPLSSLSSNRAIASYVNGVPTDVIPVGDLVAAARPTPCGVSVGHYAITAGTLGCLVKKHDDDDNLFILSNNHVLADCDRAHIGDLILEPGPDDGGRIDDPIAHLTDFEPIAHGNPNTIDAAIARLLETNSVTNDIIGIGCVQQPPAQAVANERVLKHGRTTNLTEGVVVGIAEDVTVRYGTQLIDFEEQLAIIGHNGPFASLGDSGALVIGVDTKCPIGLFFAVDLQGLGTAFANPITPVLERFGIEVL